MVWDFEYFNRDQVGEIASFGKALPCLVGANAIVDSDFLTVIEAAERGVFEAMCEAARIFMTGVKGVPRNYHLAKRYLDGILVVNENKK